MATIITRAGKGSELEYFEVDANFTNLNSDKADKVDATDQTFAGNLAINKPAGNSRFLAFLSGAVLRWKIEATNATETGSGNAGSNLAINRYSDAGAVIDSPITISRSTGIVDFALTPTVGGVAVALSNQLGSYVLKAGDTMTGALTIDYANAALTVGDDGAANAPVVNLRSGGAGAAYDARIAATGGTATAGAGTLTVTAATTVHSADSTTNGTTRFGSAAGYGYANADADVAYYYGAKSVVIGGTGAGSYTALIASNAEVARLTTGGRLLVGTTTDNGVDKLQVTGSIKATADIAAGQDLKVTRRTLLAGATDDGASALQVNGKITAIDGAFTNSPIMPTPTAGDNSTKGATTAFVGTADTAALAVLSATFIGVIQAFAHSAPDANYWLLCNAQVVSRTTYAALFAKIGTTYGAGDGSTTFALPDLRGEFLRGLDNGRGVDSGRSIGSNQGEMIGPHNHPIRASVTGWTGGNSGVTYANGDNNGNVSVSGGGATFGVQANSGTENRPRNVAMPFYIRYK